jgi:hypothetical protein
MVIFGGVIFSTACFCGGFSHFFEGDGLRSESLASPYPGRILKVLNLRYTFRVSSIRCFPGTKARPTAGMLR